MSKTIKDMHWKVKLAKRVNPTILAINNHLTDMDTPLVKGSEASEILYSSYKGKFNGIVLQCGEPGNLYSCKSAFQEDNTIGKRSDRRNMNQMCHQMTTLANSDPSALLDMDWD